jgi:4-amino-4-deoxy-L-arabinose transferase-like glycosyltransferase
VRLRTVERSPATAAGQPDSSRSGAAAAPGTRPLVLAFLLVFALAARVYSAVAVPPWQGPDEPKHFEYIRLLIDKRDVFLGERRLPNLSDASPQLQGQIIASLAQHHYWEYVGWLPSGPTTPAVLPQRFDDVWPQGTGLQLHRPSLYYYLAVAVVWPLQGASLESQLLAVRLFSALLSVLTVYVTYLAARQLAPGKAYLPLASAAFVATLPMHVFVGGAVNNDNLVTLAGAVCTLGLLAGLRSGFGWRQLGLAFGGLALAIATKRVGVALAPALALAILYWLWGNGKWCRLAGLAASALAILTVGLAWQIAPMREAVVGYAFNSLSQFTNLSRVSLASPEVQALLLRHVAALFCSFWGIFGWFNVLLGVEVYAVLALATGLCLLGFALWLRGLLGRSSRNQSPRRTFVVGGLLLLTALAVTALALLERLSYLSPHELPQGRYLFVAITPIAIVLALGARTLAPRRLAESSLAAYVILGSLVALDLLAYGLYIVPFYDHF